MPTISDRFAGTVSFNNMRVYGSLFVDDVSELKSKTGEIAVEGKYTADPAPTVGLPSVAIAGNFLQSYSGFDKRDSFKITKYDYSAFNAVPAIASLTDIFPTLVFTLGTETYVLIAESRVSVVTGANLVSGLVGDILLRIEQFVYVVVLLNQTTTTNYDVGVYYMLHDDTTMSVRTYGWLATNVPVLELTQNFNFNIGDYAPTLTVNGWLDASQYYNVQTISGLGY